LNVVLDVDIGLDVVGLDVVGLDVVGLDVVAFIIISPENNNKIHERVNIIICFIK